jgi:ubiquinone/menaquinone biosynthesis C-methylase UbiE
MSIAKSAGTHGPGVMDPHGLHKFGHKLWFGPVHAALVRELSPSPGQRILYVGAGTGVLAERISDTGATVICVEPDPGSLDAARQRLTGRGASFAAGNAEDIPLPSASADAAVVSPSAHHWQDRDQGFREIARVLRPGGRLVIAEFRPAGPVRALLRRLGRSKHGAALGAGEWAASLVRAGFADAHVVRAGWASLLVLVIAADKGS